MANLRAVNETSHDSPKDEKIFQPEEAFNSFQYLAAEANTINRNFTQAGLAANSSRTIDYDEPDPFQKDSEPRSSIAYRCRKWTIGGEGDDSITVAARCEPNSAIKSSSGDGEAELMSVKTLNEYFDPNARQRTDCRAKLDGQRGAVLATEVKNNANKLARWTAESLLADISQMKFGLLSRVRAGDSSPHVVLGTQTYRPKEFAAEKQG